MSDAATIKTQIFDTITGLLGDTAQGVTDVSPLLGEGGLLNSMKLVELCLLLEDKALELDFEFDWTSDAAMSRSRSMFRTAGTLADAFLDQMDSAK